MRERFFERVKTDDIVHHNRDHETILYMEADGYLVGVLYISHHIQRCSLTLYINPSTFTDKDSFRANMRNILIKALHPHPTYLECAVIICRATVRQALV
jgi:hypothetical protein